MGKWADFFFDGFLRLLVKVGVVELSFWWLVYPVYLCLVVDV